MRRAARPLLYGGVLLIALGLAQVHAHFIGHYELTDTPRWGWTFAYAAVLSVLAYGFGLPDVPRTSRSSVGVAVGAALAGAVAFSLLQLVVGDELLPRFVVFGTAVLLPDWYRLCVGMAAGGRSRAEARDRVVVVAQPREVEELDIELHASPERPASITGSFTVDQITGPGSIPLDVRLAGERPTVIVLDRVAQDEPDIVTQVATLHERGVRVRSLTLFYEEWLGKVPISELERATLLFDIGEVHHAGYARAKRVLDVPLAIAGCSVLLVVLPLVVLGNLVGNRGPLFYRQDRVGRYGSTFSIVKFRTMTPRDSGELNDEWTAVDDPRITPFGRLLRVTHVDELPQVINILRGDLSVVGPRPEQPHYVDGLSEKLPFYPLRHLVRPGLTGWAQVKFGYAGDERDALQKLQYDFHYLRQQSTAFDLRIIARTIRSVVGSQGRGR